MLNQRCNVNKIPICSKTASFIEILDNNNVKGVSFGHALIESSVETIVAQTYSAEANMWTLSLPFTLEALDDLQKIIKIDFLRDKVPKKVFSGIPPRKKRKY